MRTGQKMLSHMILVYFYCNSTVDTASTSIYGSYIQGINASVFGD